MDNTITRLTQLLISKRSAHIPDDMCLLYKPMRSRMHSCVIFDRNGTPLSFGYNDFNVKSPTTEHAEAMALRKLFASMRVKGLRSRIVVNILVVRINGGNSKPCENCIRRMYNYSQYFTIRKIYYSNGNNGNDININIVKTSFNNLLNDPNKFESSYYRNRRLGILRCNSDDSTSDSGYSDSDDEIKKKNK
jgi:cytidine deaminase